MKGTFAMTRSDTLLVLGFVLAWDGCGGSNGTDRDADLARGGSGGEEQAGGSPGTAGNGDQGSGRGVEVAVFQSSGCVDDSSALTKWLTGLERSPYSGLQCIAWAVVDDTRLLLDLGNFIEDAGFPHPEDNLWRGEATRRDDGALHLAVEWDFQYQNAGGACLQDFSFAIEGIRALGHLELEIATRSCSGTCSWREYSAELPLDTKPSGVVCRYANQLSVVVPDQLLGSLHRPPADGACGDGLVVVRLPDWEVCAPQCSESETECPMPDLLTCEDPACLIAEPW
jgi:hypothetical protein